MTTKKNLDKYLITGASGQLGFALQETFGGIEGNALPKAHEALDITDTAVVHDRIAAVQPAVVINCAAYTNVPQAEKDRERCWRVNALGVDNLARVCAERDIPLFHISTDFVFGQDFARCAGGAAVDTCAQTAYTEQCPVGPVGFYAATKTAGEHAILARASQNPDFNYYILRTAGLFERPWRQVNNFPFKIARKLCKGGSEPVRVVNDVHTNICYVEHFVSAIRWMVENRQEWSSEIGPIVPSGIYHIANQGATTWFEVAKRIAANLRTAAPVLPISRRDYANSMGMQPSSTPSYTCLDLGKYHDTCAPTMPSWQTAIDNWCVLAKNYF